MPITTPLQSLLAISPMLLIQEPTRFGNRLVLYSRAKTALVADAPNDHLYYSGACTQSPTAQHIPTSL